MRANCEEDPGSSPARLPSWIRLPSVSAPPIWAVHPARVLPVRPPTRFQGFDCSSYALLQRVHHQNPRLSGYIPKWTLQTSAGFGKSQAASTPVQTAHLTTHASATIRFMRPSLSRGRSELQHSHTRREHTMSFKHCFARPRRCSLEPCAPRPTEGTKRHYRFIGVVASRCSALSCSGRTRRPTP